MKYLSALLLSPVLMLATTSSCISANKLVSILKAIKAPGSMTLHKNVKVGDFAVYKSPKSSSRMEVIGKDSLHWKLKLSPLNWPVNKVHFEFTVDQDGKILKAMIAKKRGGTREPQAIARTPDDNNFRSKEKSILLSVPQKIKVEAGEFSVTKVKLYETVFHHRGYPAAMITVEFLDDSVPFGFVYQARLKSLFIKYEGVEAVLQKENAFQLIQGKVKELKQGAAEYRLAKYGRK